MKISGKGVILHHTQRYHKTLNIKKYLIMADLEKTVMPDNFGNAVEIKYLF